MTKQFYKQDFFDALGKQGIVLNDQQQQQFDEYALMLVEWNKKMNLTAITEIDEIYEKHFLDSLLPSFDMEINGSFCDVGAGAGIHSIPL